jgi:hypothetical protein
VDQRGPWFLCALFFEILVWEEVWVLNNTGKYCGACGEPKLVLCIQANPKFMKNSEIVGWCSGAVGLVVPVRAPLRDPGVEGGVGAERHP